jgi:hypothetical protein
MEPGTNKYGTGYAGAFKIARNGCIFNLYRKKYSPVRGNNSIDFVTVLLIENYKYPYERGRSGVYTPTNDGVYNTIPTLTGQSTHIQLQLNF